MEQLSDWDIKDFEHATQHAKELTGAEGVPYIPVDKGPYTSPQYSVTILPRIGDKVSYAFNGDSYPDGYVVKVSKTHKVITTSTGNRYYRLRQTSSWKMHKTWTLVNGHYDKRNPHI